MGSALSVDDLAAFLRDLDLLDERSAPSLADYLSVASELLEHDTVRDISLYLQRLDFLAGRLADHPKYFAHLVRSILGIEPNPHPDDIPHP